MNRTLMDLARPMLHAKNMDKQFWAEAVQTAAYIRNRVTSRSLPNDITPFHRWYGKVPNLSHARIFGSSCHYILPKSKVKSLDGRSRKAVFAALHIPKLVAFALLCVANKYCLTTSAIQALHLGFWKNIVAARSKDSSMR